MPARPLQPCGWPGCIKVQTTRYCVAHERLLRRKSSAHIPERQRLYGRQWRRIRAAQLAKEPWCAQCLREDVYTLATDVHHLVRHEGDPEKFFAGPFESLCHTHHSAETAREVGLNG